MDIEDGIRKILNSELFVEAAADEIDPDGSLRSVYGLDSLGFVELRVQCEELFGIHISDDDFSPENFHSVRSLSTMVQRLQGTS